MNRYGLVNGVPVCCTLTPEQATVSYGPDLCLVFHPAFPEEARAAFEALCRVKQVQVPPLNLDRYQAEVKGLWGTSTPPEDVQQALLVTLAELGELACQGRPEPPWEGSQRAVASQHVAEVLWDLATLCNALDLRLQQALQGNLDTLRSRYAESFCTEQSSTW